MIEKDLIFDKRIIQRNIERGRLTMDRYRQHLEKLPDSDPGSETVTVQVVPGSYESEMPEPEEEL